MSRIRLKDSEDLDVFVLSDQSWVSRVIAFFIGKWNHAGIILNAHTQEIAHADCGKVMKEPLSRMLSRSPKWELKILRLRPEHKMNKEKALKFVQSQVGKKYGTMNAIGRGIYRFFSWLGISRKDRSIFYDDNELICSVFVASILDDQSIITRDHVHFTQMEPEDFLASDKFTVTQTINYKEQ
jgi:hypothetical protein